MATLSVANAKTILDKIAAQAAAMVAVFGDDVGDTGSIAESAQANVTAILALDDEDQEVALLGPAQIAVQRVLAGNLFQHFKELVRAIDKHVGGLNSFLSTNDERLHWYIRTIFPSLRAANVFPPVVDPIATFTTSGAGAGTYTHVADIDTTQYGKANLVAKMTADSGANALEATITCVKIDGTTEDKVVALASKSNGDEVDIGTHDTDMYVGVSNITITGGAAGENFKVISELERSVSL